MMKRIIVSLVLSGLVFGVQAQLLENLDFAFVYAPGTTLANIKDDYRASSNEDLAADGYTYIDENALRATTVKLSANYNFDDTWALGTGFFFNQIRMNPRNQDGSYIGTSVYYANYLSLPLILRFRSNEVTDNLRLVGSLGPSLDIRTGEGASGSDYAHYMNFADNRYDIDPERGRNGNDKNMNLFGTFGFSIHASFEAEYMLGDHFYVMSGITYQHRLNNLLNGRLTYNDPEKTPVTEHLVFKAHTLAFELGVGYRLP